MPSPAIEETAQGQAAGLPPFDAAALTFVEGKYRRDEFCSRVFNYQKTTFGPLTIAIAGNLTGEADHKALASKVIQRLIDLDRHSPVPLRQPLTVYVIPNPEVGECFSRDGLVFTAPEALESTAFVEDVLGAVSGSSEPWVVTGLTALALGEQPDDAALKNWYQNTGDLNMVGLFAAYFYEDWATGEERAIARLSAASLVRYAVEVEKIAPDGLAEGVNNAVRTRWLASLGVDRAVTYPHDGRFAGFRYSRSTDCSLRAQAEGMDFCLNRLPEQEYFDEIHEAEFLIDYAYHGRKALTDYLLAEAPSVGSLLNPRETVTIKVVDLQGRLGYASGNTIMLNKSSVYYDALHEITHTFDWNQALTDIWLVEGFAEYMGTLLPVYQQPARRCVYDDLSGRLNDASTSDNPGTSYWYFLDAEQLAAAKDWYLAQGGRMESEETVDPRLFADAVAFATVYRDAHSGSRGIPIGVKYDILYPGRKKQWAGQDGLELSYTQSAAFLAWLCDTYTLDRVLDVYVNGAEDGKLDGKTYAQLKSAWQADLLSKGAGITVPGAP